MNRVRKRDKPDKEHTGSEQVSLDGTGTVLVIQGNQESLTIEAEDNIIPHIVSSVKGNMLAVSDDNTTPSPTRL